MPSNPRPPAVLGYLKSAVGANAEPATDHELLARFARTRDQSAFELLVWRHAGMVLHTGRTVLRDDHAAEDVCQATFLALARQAASAGRRGSVAGWLYCVARRLGARVAARRRRESAAGAVDLDRLAAPGQEIDPIASAELAERLHHELDRLPDKYRAPVLMCFFDGLSHTAAAERLGWPVGTVAGRLARAKERLRRRLAPCGMSLPVTLPASAATAPVFVAATARAAVAFATGATTTLDVSTHVVQLARGALRSMTINKLQWAAGILAACSVVTLSGAWAVGQRRPEPPPPAEAKPASPDSARTANGAQRRRSLDNLKQILLAFHNHHDVTGYLPADIRAKNGKPLLSWRVAILPYIDQQALYKQFRLDEPWDSEHNMTLLAKMPQILQVGVEPPGATNTYYRTFAGPGTPFNPNPGKPDAAAAGGAGSAAGPGDSASGAGSTPAATVPAGRYRMTHIVDGTSNTLAVVEAGPPVPWTKPADIPYDPSQPLPRLVGPFTNVLHAAAFDGSVRALKRSIDETVLRHLIEMNDGNPTPDWRTLQAPQPAETPEEKAALRKQLADNQKTIEEIGRLMKRQIEELEKQNGQIDDAGVAERQAELLDQLLKSLQETNRRLRGDDRKDHAPVEKK